MQPTDRRVTDIAARQHGLVTRTQLLAAGVSPDILRWWVRGKRVQTMHRGVYLVGPIVAPLAREMAAVLACGPGAVISHRSAAVLWHLCGRRSGIPVDVTLTRSDRGRRPGIRRHRALNLKAEEGAEIDGIPVTSLTRTVFDLASEVDSGELAQVLAHAAKEHATIHAELLALMARNPNRRGVAVLRALLADDTSPALTRSEAEERVLHLIRKAHLPRPEVNVTIDRYEVDFLWRAARLVLEVDGFAFHSSRAQFENDRRRDATLAALGFRVMRVTWRQIVAEPEAMIVRLAQALVHAATGVGGN